MYDKVLKTILDKLDSNEIDLSICVKNKNDVKYLKSNEGQKQIAQSIYNAIFKYKNYYETTLNSELDK